MKVFFTTLVIILVLIPAAAFSQYYWMPMYYYPSTSSSTEAEAEETIEGFTGFDFKPAQEPWMLEQKRQMMVLEVQADQWHRIWAPASYTGASSPDRDSCYCNGRLVMGRFDRHGNWVTPKCCR